MVVWAARGTVALGVSALLTTQAARAAAPVVAPSVGDTAWALPGIVRVGVPGAGLKRVAVSGMAGYGHTEAQPGEDGAHHRLMGSLALGVVPVRALALSLRFDGRNDMHPDDGEGTHSGSVGDPRLLARFGGAVGGDLAAGGEIVAWVPGKDAPSLVPAATTVDAAALVAWAPARGPTLALRAGFRLDQSAEAAPDVTRLRPGDRLALGLSDSHAVLLAAGVAVPFGATEVLGEVSWDLLMGSDAPGALESPLRVDAGVRHALSELLSVQVLAEVSPSGRPDLGPADPLVPIEPRFGVMLAARMRWPLEKEERARPGDEPDAPVDPEKPPPPAPAAPGKTVVRVADADGAPLAGATVTVTVGDFTKEATADATGAVEIEGVPAGEGTVRVEAEGFTPTEERTRFEPGKPAEVAVKLKSAVVTGQLRGLIRSFAGKGIAAVIKVEPGGSEVKSDASGTFTLDLPPGEYEVVITAPGFKEQRRKVKVELNGVTVLNAELFEGRR